MVVNSIGDMAQAFMLRRLTTSIKQGATTAAHELTTGHTMDVSRKLGGDLSQLTGLEATLSRLKGYRVATDSLAITSNAMQSVMGQIDTFVEGVGTSLLSAANSGNSQTLEDLIRDTSTRFDSILSALNTKVGDKTLFAGIASDGPAVASSETILAALEAAVVGAGASTATDIKAAVTAWFDDPNGFATIGYLGGTGSGFVKVSADDRIDLGLTAADPSLRETLKSLAMVALIGRGTVISDTETGVQLAQFAGNALFQNQSDRTFRAADLGLAQARIEQAQTRNEAEGTALKLARSDLLAVDPYDAATRMEAAQTQLETLYSVTARLSRLSLVDFLR